MKAHFAGFSMVIVSFHAHSGAGVRGLNAGRYQRLAVRPGIPERLHGTAITAGEAATCNLGAGTVIDYVMCSKSAVPFGVSVTPVLAAPWRPHIGLEVTLRSSGEQLVTRVLEVPGRLPQVPRPTSEPTVGSKSSTAKSERQAQHQVAVGKRAQTFDSLFGDCGPQSSCARSEGEGSGDQDAHPPESRGHT
eukprot:6271147-Pyramimonas_sp.AAC.1